MKRVMSHMLDGEPWPSSPISNCVSLTEGIFCVDCWADGNLQVSYDPEQMHRKLPPSAWPVEILECVRGPNSKRKRWALVDRTGVHCTTLYPPLVAKGTTYPDFPTALVAYQTYIALKYGITEADFEQPKETT